MINSNAFGLERVAIRLVNDGMFLSKTKINTPQIAVGLMGDYLRDMDKEVVMVLNLATDNKPINCSIVSIGSINKSIASPKDILKSAILANAAGIILIHNHPSGDIHPSKEDIKTTDRLIKICDMMEIPLRDHLIVGPGTDCYFSFHEKGCISKPTLYSETNYNNITFSNVAEPDEW